MVKESYPVIDLFAGPGGLGEGFATIRSRKNAPVFVPVASFERDQYAHQTLRLRHFFRTFDSNPPNKYYEYLEGKISITELAEIYPKKWKEAESSACRISLGIETHEHVKKIINEKLNGRKKWVLVGGPPCQAYSLVGRARRAHDAGFEQDEKHFLYKEYLKIIVDHQPPVFVMENVKGLLSAKVNGEPVLQKILRDLSKPKLAVEKKENGLSYRLYSLSKKGVYRESTDPSAFIVKAEEYGVPQARHRMFILGIRSDLKIEPEILNKEKAPTVEDIIGSLPKIRSGVSGGPDTQERWEKLIRKTITGQWFKKSAAADRGFSQVVQNLFNDNMVFPTSRISDSYQKPGKMRNWFFDERLPVLTGHESRSHMESDIERYLFASIFALAKGTSPKLADFPRTILPHHKNVEEGRTGKMFSDRFRVQLYNRFSTTVTSHISKDGHYFIHYDPVQCRSLTVREAARLQTFPDNYQFEGPRTAQYHQVGNAVPPFLAAKIAEVVEKIMAEMDDD
ncbi:MAG: DNA (cytosine-5-)-methyltransferase [Erysipelotrichia bacterium]|nr:DNA (cytosine-5-)-methyltransferase [Erysipelotrichia bacterium]